MYSPLTPPPAWLLQDEHCKDSVNPSSHKIKHIKYFNFTLYELESNYTIHLKYSHSQSSIWIVRFSLLTFHLNNLPVSDKVCIFVS